MSDTRIMATNPRASSESVREEYRTTNQTMVEVFIMSRFSVLRIEIDGDNQLVWYFDHDKVWDVAQMVMTGNTDEISFTLADYLRAKNAWTAALRHLTQYRKR